MDKASKEAMDKAAMDAAERVAAPLRAQIARLEAGSVKAVLGQIAKRDQLASQLSGFVGTFDASEMTLDEVAKYGVKKLEIPTMDGQEVSAIMAYLHGRKAPLPTAVHHGMDSTDANNPLRSYLKPREAA